MKLHDLPRAGATSTVTADKLLFESAMSRHRGVVSQFSAGIEYRVQTGEVVVGIWDAAKKTGTVFGDLVEETVAKKAETQQGAELYEATGGAISVDKAGAVKKDGKAVALKFEKDKGKMMLLIGGDDQDRVEVPDDYSGDMASCIDWLAMSWKTIMKILASSQSVD